MVPLNSFGNRKLWASNKTVDELAAYNFIIAFIEVVLDTIMKLCLDSQLRTSHSDAIQFRECRGII
jgi:hypothetical protein